MGMSDLKAFHSVACEYKLMSPRIKNPTCTIPPAISLNKDASYATRHLLIFEMTKSNMK